MINNRGILSTSDLLGRRETSARSNTNTDFKPTADSSEYNKGVAESNSQNTKNTGELGTKQSAEIDSANTQPRNPSTQANKLSASGPTEAQTQVNSEASKTGQKVDPGDMAADVPPSDPKTGEKLDTGDINASIPKVKQNPDVPNSDRTDSMSKLNEKSSEQSAPTMDASTPDMESPNSPKSKEVETPEHKRNSPDIVKQRQQFHRMPEVETPDGSMPQTRVPQIKSPNIKNPGGIPSPKMRMPSLRIPKMR